MHCLVAMYEAVESFEPHPGVDCSHDKFLDIHLESNDVLGRMLRAFQCVVLRSVKYCFLYWARRQQDRPPCCTVVSSRRWSQDISTCKGCLSKHDAWQSCNACLSHKRCYIKQSPRFEVYVKCEAKMHRKYRHPWTRVMGVYYCLHLFFIWSISATLCHWYLFGRPF